MKQIDLNCDLGESYGKFSSDHDAGIMPFISSCNIAAGFHSGDPHSISRTIQLALKNKVAIGAHPSFPDLQGFGRRVMHLSKGELISCVQYQVAAVKGMTEAVGGTLHHVKPHGALYNYASKDKDTAVAIAEALAEWLPGVKLYAPWKSALADAALEMNMEVAFESFADRKYEDDRSLRSRQKEGAVLSNDIEVLDQVDLLTSENKVITFTGAEIDMKTDTICLHSDTKGALELAGKIYNHLKEHGVHVRPV
ncbi:5-oxoprolinase subunit PxpA [Balneola sp. MJW-20]|uniref:5-oxoprolinase subunit PxpA n=1 Tax=Gracilimonas aurantiaca TaxID=3234185 RepID=UPI00346784C6